MQIDIDALERNKSNDVRKYNILKILNNVDAIFTGAYVHYKEMSKETVFERSITERLKSRKEGSAEIKRKEQNINNELLQKYFTDYQSSSNMYNKLINPENVRIIKILVDSIKKRLTRVKKSIEKVSENKTFKIGENEKIIDIVERILEFNNKIQSGQGLKLLTASQMFCRLPISLAQLNAGNSEKLKNEIRQLLCSLYRSKKLTKHIYKSLVDII